MKADAFNQLIILYGWFLLVGLMLFLMLIARFYQRFAGEKTYYQLFLIPMMLFGVQVVRRTNYAADTLGNASAALGGIVLLALSLYLYRRMTAGRGNG
ncbi:MAG: hypothetical protein U0703_21445 [Anaerolineae bacterium]